MSDLNVYGMWAAYGNRGGFFIQRNSWAPGRTFAIVHSIAGKIEGLLPGKPPYHGNPEVRVLFIRVIGVKPGPHDEAKWWPGNVAVTEQALSCPGTYAYEQIEPPDWFDWWGVGEAYRGRRPWQIAGGHSCSIG